MPAGPYGYRVIELLGQITGSGSASAALCAQYGIPASVLAAANLGGIYDVTALLAYL
jgi:hypothetical protein